MSQSVVLDELADAVQTFDSDKVMEATRKALAAGIDSSTIIEQGIAKGLKVVGWRTILNALSRCSGAISESD